MAGTVDVGQLRSICRSLPAQQHCLIQAGTLLALIELVKTLQGSEANLTVSGVPSNGPPVNLTSFHS